MAFITFALLTLSCMTAALNVPVVATWTIYRRCSSPVASAQEEAKSAWRGKLTAIAVEDAASQAWQTRLDAQTWTEVVSTVSAKVMLEGVESATAKQAWLARLDAPTWGAVAAAVAEVAASVQLQEPCEKQVREAKRAWLARLDASSWVVGAATLLEVAGGAAAMEQDAVWLAELDASVWGAVSTAVATVAVEVTLQTTDGMTADEIARAAWLVQLDTASWGQPQSTSLQGMNLRTREMSAEEAAIRAQMG